MELDFSGVVASNGQAIPQRSERAKSSKCDSAVRDSNPSSRWFLEPWLQLPPFNGKLLARLGFEPGTFHFRRKSGRTLLKSSKNNQENEENVNHSKMM